APHQLRARLAVPRTDQRTGRARLDLLLGREPRGLDGIRVIAAFDTHTIAVEIQHAKFRRARLQIETMPGSKDQETITIFLGADRSAAGCDDTEPVRFDHSGNDLAKLVALM